MANARVRSRPIAPLVLSAQEWAYLERQVRRHRLRGRFPTSFPASTRRGVPDDHTGGVFRRDI
jgi:hypothetical protein